MDRPALLPRAVVAAVALLLLVPVAPALASPTPDPVCGACGAGFEDAAAANGLPVTVTNATATVRVRANGSATWTVTNRVNASAADRLRERPDALARIAREAAADGWGLPGVFDDGEVRLREASIDGRTVRVRFDDPDAAQRRAGVLVVDYLHTEGYGGGWILNADRFTVVGPAGTRLVNDPRATIDDEYADPVELPTVDDDRVTWHGSAAAEYGPTLHEDVYLAFDDGGAGGDARVAAALALATAPIWLSNLRAFALPAVVVYGVLLVGVGAGARRATGSVLAPDLFARSVAGAGVAGIVVAGMATVVDESAAFVGAAAVYLVVGTVATVRPRRLRSTRRALGVGAAALVAVAVATAGIDLLGGDTGRLVERAARAAAIHLPLAVAPAFGLAASRRDRRTTVLAFAGAVASLAVAAAVFVPFATRPWGLLLVFTVGGAIAAAALGTPLAALAARERGAITRDPERE
jgi:hypothetical protein